jgi:hypothetical protein
MAKALATPATSAEMVAMLGVASSSTTRTLTARP